MNISKVVDRALAMGAVPTKYSPPLREEMFFALLLEGIPVEVSDAEAPAPAYLAFVPENMEFKITLSVPAIEEYLATIGVQDEEKAVAIIRGMIKHELMHYSLLHWRKDHKPHELWNVACDAVINPTIDELNLVPSVTAVEAVMGSPNAVAGAIIKGSGIDGVDAAEPLFAILKELSQQSQQMPQQMQPQPPQLQPQSQQSQTSQQSQQTPQQMQPQLPQLQPQSQQSNQQSQQSQPQLSQNQSNQSSQQDTKGQSQQTSQQSNNQSSSGQGQLPPADFDKADIPEELVEDIIRRITEAIEKSRGTVAAGIVEEVLVKFKPKRLRFPNVAAKHLTNTAMSQQTTWKRLSRRYRMPPGTKWTNIAPTIVVFIDASASVSNEELNDALNVVLNLSPDEAEIEVWTYDTKLQRRIPDAEIRRRKVKVKGRGGTDFNAAASEYSKRFRKHHDIAIVITDGYDETPDKELLAAIADKWIFALTKKHSKDYADAVAKLGDVAYL